MKRILEIISIEQIAVDENRRQPDAENERRLIDSIHENGLMSPISVSYDKENHFYKLIAGANRLNAVRKIGLGEIEAFVYSDNSENADALNDGKLNADELKIMEIDENLVRVELTKTERAFALKERKEIYEKLYPETKKGFINRVPKENRLPSFVKDAAQKFGMSESSVQKSVQLADRLDRIDEKLDRSAFEILAHSNNNARKFAETEIELVRLSNYDLSEQITLAEIAVEHNLSTCAEAYQRYSHPDDFDDSIMTKQELKDFAKMDKESQKGTPLDCRIKFTKYVIKLKEETNRCLEEILPVLNGDGRIWEKKTINGFIKAIDESIENLNLIKGELSRLHSECEK